MKYVEWIEIRFNWVFININIKILINNKEKWLKLSVSTYDNDVVNTRIQI